ncbi:response regulator transcription factor [Bacillus sp. 03113]|uniref:response regulator transcription factor n=1 Tax=Bacillus sp. 03113 TaxID=2578211 RepID=UPI00114299ED|nr:response regulator transcription factor [Bacillus sp. 03113]
MSKINILIAEDHPIYRDGLSNVLSFVEEFDVIGQAESGEEALVLVEQLKPDVVLMDINLPGINGIEATREISQNYPSVKVLILTMFDDDKSVFSAMKAGARGYLLKGAKQKEIMRAIYAIADGEAIFSPMIANRMMSYFQSIHANPADKAFPELTIREKEILDYMAKGFEVNKIAKQLGISPKTARNHISNILNKLQVTDKAEAILLAREAGLGEKEYPYLG